MVSLFQEKEQAERRTEVALNEAGEKEMQLKNQTKEQQDTISRLVEASQFRLHISTIIFLFLPFA